MNFQQLRSVREAARRNFNLTDVANALFTSSSTQSDAIEFSERSSSTLSRRRIASAIVSQVFAPQGRS